MNKQKKPLLTPAMLRPKLDKLTLPLADTSKPVDEADPLYKPILRQLGVESQQELNMLRRVVAQKIEDMQDEKRKETIKRVTAGEIVSPDDIPLLRGSDGTLRNIPDDIMPWFVFVAWLNEKAGRRGM